MGNEHENNCGFASEAVSYLYGEMPASERSVFEDHLVDCDACTDEFAAISYSRVSVMEWQRGEFAHLPTPEIVIPYEPARAASWVDGVRGLFALPGFGTAIAMAGLLIVITAAFVGYYVNSLTEVPVTVTVPLTDKPAVTDAPTSRPAEVIAPLPVPVTVSEKRPASRPAQPLPAVAKQRAPKVVRPLTADLNRDIKPVAPVVKEPVLSTYDDEDDKSLRLTDLLDDGGV